MTRFPRDRFDDIADGPRVGAHRGMPRRGRGWIAFAWAALATGVLVGIGVLVLALLNGSVQFSDPGTGSSPSSSSSASATPGAGSSGSASSERTAEPSAQNGSTLVVLNGTTTAGLAATGTSTLSSAGWNVTSDGNAGSTDATSTIVYYQKESDAAVARGIAKTLGVGTVQQSAAFPNADITVVLGADYAG
jgi:hypothetical protein